MHEHTERSTMKLDSKPTRITEWILNPRTPQRLAVAAVILLSVVPVVFFIRNMIFFPCHARDYYPYFHQMAVGLSALALFSFFYQCYMQKRNVVTLLRETPPMLWFLGMTVLMLLSCLVNGVNNYARYGFNVNETIYLSFAFFLLYFPAGLLIRRPSDKRLILRLFVITGMFTAVTELIHIYITPLDVYSAYGYYAVPPMLMFPNTNFYGYLLSMFLPACAGLVIAEESLFWRVFSFAAFLANAAVLFLNGTFGAVLAVPCALIFQVIVIFLTKKRLSVMTLVLLGSYLLLYVLVGLTNEMVFWDVKDIQGELNTLSDEYSAGMNSTNVRYILWKASVAYILERPLLGWGPEGVNDMLNELAGQLRAHNEYLQYATFYGIPAGICYIAGCFSVYLHGLKHRKELDLYTVTCLVTAFSYLASAFVGNTKMLTTGLFFCILGLGFSVEKQDVPDKET